MITWFSGLRGHSLLFRTAVLGLVPLPVLLAIAPIAVHYAGIAGLAAAAVAAVLCLAGACPALVICNRLRKPNEALAGLLAGTLVRMGVPLMFGLAIHFCGGPLAEAGLIYYLLIFYLVTLAAGTVLALPVKPKPATRRKTSSGTAVEP
jgi:hypothetical protein